MPGAASRRRVAAAGRPRPAGAAAAGAWSGRSASETTALSLESVGSPRRRIGGERGQSGAARSPGGPSAARVAASAGARQARGRRPSRRACRVRAAMSSLTPAQPRWISAATVVDFPAPWAPANDEGGVAPRDDTGMHGEPPVAVQQEAHHGAEQEGAGVGGQDGRRPGDDHTRPSRRDVELNVVVGVAEAQTRPVLRGARRRRHRQPATGRLDDPRASPGAGECGRVPSPAPTKSTSTSGGPRVARGRRPGCVEGCVARQRQPVDRVAERYRRWRRRRPAVGTRTHRCSRRRRHRSSGPAAFVSVSSRTLP